MVVQMLIDSLFRAESLSTEKRGLHQKARGAGPRLSSLDRELQSSTGRELSITGLHNQPAIEAVGISR